MIEREKLISMVQDLKDGKEDAAAVIYETFHKKIYYQIYETVNRDAELAADLTQDTFLYVLKKINDLNDNVAFVTWIEKIAASKCKDYSIKRKELLVDEYEDGYSIFDKEEEYREEFIPGEALDKEDLKRIILDIINKLPQEQREAILLRYFNEISVKEIAYIQGVSEGTVKSRLNYGRKALKDAVETYEKKNDIRLHCAGVVPMLLWFFRAYRTSNGISLTASSASATFSAAAVSETTAASAAAASTASSEAVKTGIGLGTKAAGKAVATKAVAAVTAATVAVGGVAVGIGLNREESKTIEGSWAGHIYSVDRELYDTSFVYADNCHTYDFSLEEVSLPDSALEVEIEAFDVTQEEFKGIFRCDQQDGTTFETRFLGLFDYDPEYHYSIFFDFEEPLIIYDSQNGIPLPLGGMYGSYNEKEDRINIYFSHYTRYETGFYINFGELFRTEDAQASHKTSESSPAASSGEYTERGVGYSLSQDGSFYWAEIVDFTDANVMIASEKDGLPVRGIRNFTALAMENIILPDSITILDWGAFSGCRKLKGISLPDGITSISDFAFSGCYSMEYIGFPAHINHIGDQALAHCGSLTNVVLPEGVLSLGSEAFLECLNLESISLPASLTEIGSAAFLWCEKLNTVVIDENNPKYYSVGSFVIEKDSHTLITSNDRQEIPSDANIAAIGPQAYHSSLFTHFTIPEGVEYVGSRAFQASQNLTSLSLPLSIRYIEYDAFHLCFDLREIHFPGTIEAFRQIEGIRWEKEFTGLDCTIYCSDGSFSNG